MLGIRSKIRPNIPGSIAPRPMQQSGMMPLEDEANFAAMMQTLNQTQPKPMPHGQANAPPPRPQQPQQPQAGLMGQPQQSPVQGLFSQQFEKPKMTWSDKLGLISGMLMDYDGTMGSGNADKARGLYDQRVAEQQGQFEENRQQQLMMAAASGDPMALAMLDPVGNRDFQFREKRLGVEDARYAEQTDYARRRDETDDEYRERVFGRGVFESDREAASRDRERRAAAERENRSSQRPVALGDGSALVLNPQTNRWEMQRATPAAGEPFRPDPRQFDTPFFQDQGITADMFFPTSFPQGGGGAGPDINQQGELDNTRPDDQGRGSDMGEYATYRGRARGSGDAKRMEAIRSETAENINNLDVLLNEVDSLMAQGVPTGALAGTRLEMGRWNQGLKGATGIDLSQAPLIGGMVPDAQQTAGMSAMKSIETQLGLLRTQQTKGAISNYEMELFLQSVPGLQNTPEGNELIKRNMRNLQNRQIEYGRAADTWDQTFGALSNINPRTGQSFDQAWADYARSNTWLELPEGASPTSGAVPSASAGQGQPIRIQDAAGYASVPSGALYIAPDGKTRKKP